MKNFISPICCSFGLALAVAVTAALAQDKSTKGSTDPTEMMKKAELAGAPSAAHKVLDPLVGDWNAEVRLWMSPGAPGMTNRASAKSTWAMKGRFVQQEFDGEFMGKPFRGLSYTGYDNTKRKYNTVWIDDMNTAIYTSEGDLSEGGKTITFEGHYDCPMTGEKNKAAKQVYRIVSRDRHIYEMHDPARGTNSLTMEIVYTRR